MSLKKRNIKSTHVTVCAFVSTVLRLLWGLSSGGDSQTRILVLWELGRQNCQSWLGKQMCCHITNENVKRYKMVQQAGRHFGATDWLVLGLAVLQILCPYVLYLVMFDIWYAFLRTGNYKNRRKNLVLKPHDVLKVPVMRNHSWDIIKFLQWKLTNT